MNPFIDRNFKLTFVALQLSEILKYGVGFDSRNLTFYTEVVDNVTVKEGTDNPFLIDNDGNKQEYQRPLVWNDDDKRLLIDAIYNRTDIGKFVVIRRDYPYIKKQIKLGNTKDLGFHELVDGKQRLNAIVDFMQDKFADSNGNYYSEFDEIAKREFRSYNHCTLAILENPTPAEIKRAFLNVNYTGKPMSKDHIDFIKSLNV